MRIMLATALVAFTAASAVVASPDPFARAAIEHEQALVARLRPEGRWLVWGQTQPGGNPTLRDDIAGIGRVADQLARLAGPASPEARRRAARRLHRFLDGYQRHIAAHWSLSPATAAAFAAAAATIDRALAPAPANPYLAKVDAAIADPGWRRAVAAVQPAVVKLGGGTGVNLAARGLVLTAAHVVDEVGREVAVRFPDGTSRRGVCTHLDLGLDLAVVELERGAALPWAPLADAAPAVGAEVVAIGHPGQRTPDGEATGYQPWHVSVGHIRGFRGGDRTGAQHLGRTKHDAWTYWGHSGSPLFDRRGAIVALHNSWDSTTAMRHAVTWEAIVAFLNDADVDLD